MAPINRITPDDVKAFAERPTLSAYQRAATKSAFYPGQGTALGLNYAALKLNGESGELAEHVGKAMRDDALITRKGADVTLGQLTKERHALIVKEVGDVLWYLSAICNELGVDLADAAYTNLCKLCDLGERNTLRGSGDTR